MRRKPEPDASLLPQVVVKAGPHTLHLVKVPGQGKSWAPLPRKLTDAEAGRVILPKLPVFVSAVGVSHRSDGTGRLYQPPSDFDFGSVVDCIRRYLDAMHGTGHEPSKAAYGEGPTDNGRVAR